MPNNTQQPLPEFLREYFWDVRFQELDIEKNPRFILKRIIDLGNTKSLQWALSIFSLDDIKDIVTTSRDLSRKTATFWTFIMDLDPKKIPCLQKPYSRTPFGLSN